MKQVINICISWQDDQLLTKRDLDYDTLYDAVKATFDNRGLTYNPELQLFTEGFATDVARITRWKAFLKKIQWKEALDFDTVMEVIRERLQPMAENIGKSSLPFYHSFVFEYKEH